MFIPPYNASPLVLPLGLLGDGDLRGEPDVSVGGGEAGHQAAAPERGQWLDGVPHRTAGLAHGRATPTPRSPGNAWFNRYRHGKPVV